MKLMNMPKDLSIRRAAAYLISYWTGLTAFVRNPDVPPDNNGCYAVLGISAGIINRYRVCSVQLRSALWEGGT